MQLLQAEGCSFASIFVDGGEIVIDGWAPSYEAKQRLHQIVRSSLPYPVRNTIRIYPN